MSDRLYYPHVFNDEVVPCDCTLQGWADWMSKPDPDWSRPAAEKPGTTFVASVAEIRELECRKIIGGWSFDEAAEAELIKGGGTFYLRHDQGAGWWPDNSGGTALEALGFVGEIETGEYAYLAALTFVGEVELRYDVTDDGPRVFVVSEVGHA